MGEGLRILHGSASEHFLVSANKNGAYALIFAFAERVRRC